MYKALFTFLLAFSFHLAFAQTTNISGVVKDKNAVLIGANVFLEGTYSGTSTGVDGSFKFQTEETGKQTLVINYIGYESFQQEVYLDGSDINFEIVLKEEFNQLTAVTVTAGAFEAGDKKKTVVLNSIDMVTTAGALGDVTGALQMLPGTTTVGESGRLFVRGGDSRESGTYVDGMQVHKPYNAQVPNLSTRGRFSPFMFKGTVFSTGAYSAEYGQALSSVLALETKGLQTQEQFDFSIMSIGVDAAITEKWKTGAITATAEYTDLSPYMAAIPQRDEWVRAPQTLSFATSVRQQTAYSGLFKMYSKYDRSNFHLIQDDLNSDTGKNDIHITNDNFYTNASWKGIISDSWAMQLGTSYTYDNNDLTSNENAVREKLNAQHAKVKLSNFSNPMLNFKFGVDYFSTKLDYELENSELIKGFDYNENRYAAYTEADIYASSNLVFRAGFRAEYSDYLDEVSWSPRLSTAYKFNKHTQMSMAYGIFYQNPDRYYLLYTDQLSEERADHYMLNFQYDKNKRNIRAEVYYKDYNSLVKNLEEAPYYNNNGYGNAYGFDFYFRDKKTIKNGDFWVSYSYINSERDYMDYPELATPGFVSKHNLSLVYKHWVGKLKSFPSFSYQYGSPRLYTDPNKGGFQDQYMKPYHNLSVSWTYLIRQNIIVYASAKNVLGFDQEFGYTYSDTPNSEGVYDSQRIEPGAKRFFFLGCFITLSRDKSLNQLDQIDY